MWQFLSKFVVCFGAYRQKMGSDLPKLQASFADANIYARLRTNEKNSSWVSLAIRPRINCCYRHFMIILRLVLKFSCCACLKSASTNQFLGIF